jgi:hypothetical protein
MLYTFAFILNNYLPDKNTGNNNFTVGTAHPQIFSYLNEVDGFANSRCPVRDDPLAGRCTLHMKLRDPLADIRTLHMKLCDPLAYRSPLHSTGETE